MINRKIGIVVLALAGFAAGLVWQIYSRADFVTLDGQRHQWQGYRGEWVVVNYFAEWCAPCLREVPELNRFARQVQQDPAVSLFAISYDPLSQTQLADLKAAHGMAFPLIAEIEQQGPLQRPRHLPATYIVAPDGTLHGPLLGEQTAASLTAALEKLRAAG
ncbi:TlpA family protein disulfide reductase [Aestuariibacter halophilus]|uniref:TlpA family protein disulfide reductase n=1 Tax=Fluctibacter halophilus TaxID=226011 RepID=A0ABS8G4Q4_9ALTE|nr:TlpA disulfide reductase family protein [Aestuariibacter halophilus]MCC2615572.1 TlpA family protein disulfide reductase [Aestuariibacter halophilus]